MKKVLILSFECLYIHISVKKNYKQSLGYWWDHDSGFVPHFQILNQRL